MLKCLLEVLGGPKKKEESKLKVLLEEERAMFAAISWMDYIHVEDIEKDIWS